MAGIRKTLAGIRHGLGWLEEAFLCFLLMAMIVLACVQIFLRLVFSSGFMWVDPLLRYMVLWAGLFGAAAATKRGKNIAVDIASHLIPPRFTPLLHTISNFFAAFVCAVLTYAAVLFVQNEAAFGGGRHLLGLASWEFNLVFPLAFALITLRFVAACFRNLKGSSHEPA